MITLYRFAYSCYARKVQAVLDLMKAEYQIREVPFGDRTELVTITNGYVQVPVMVDDNDSVVVDSRAICERLTMDPRGKWLVRNDAAGPIWAYSDWCDSQLEDVMFRLASPHIRCQFSSAADRAMFTFIKERKYGKGCVEEWERNHKQLIDQASQLLDPTRTTLASQGFIFGTRPSLADAALFGQFAMIETAGKQLPTKFGPEFTQWLQRLRSWTTTRNA